MGAIKNLIFDMQDGDEQQARRWIVEQHRIQPDQYCVTDGAGNYLNNDGRISEHPYYVNAWLAHASADRANTHGLQPPEWRTQFNGTDTNVYYGDEYRATFRREADAIAWMEAQRDE